MPAPTMTTSGMRRRSPTLVGEIGHHEVLPTHADALEDRRTGRGCQAHGRTEVEEAVLAHDAGAYGLDDVARLAHGDAAGLDHHPFRATDRRVVELTGVGLVGADR